MAVSGDLSDPVILLHGLIQNVVRRCVFPQLLSAVPAAAKQRSAKHPSARERRASIARCRTLRQEIAAFEAQYTASKGHAPKGAERFPLHAVYEEYRSLKIRIRDDAATHIQAVFKGHRCRKRMNRPSRQTTRDATNSSEAAIAKPALKRPSPAELAALRDEKASLKRALRAFDLQFASDHGRPPSKSEKEHLRPQYTRYHELKTVISRLEEGTEAATTRPASAGAETTGRPSLQASTAQAAQELGRTAQDDDAHSRRSDSFASVAGIDGAEGLDEDDGPSAPAGGASGRPSSAGTTATPGSLAALKAEKKKLQAFLRDYEKSFQDRWGRPVRLVKGEATGRLAPALAPIATGQLMCSPCLLLCRYSTSHGQVPTVQTTEATPCGRRCWQVSMLWCTRGALDGAEGHEWAQLQDCQWCLSVRQHRSWRCTGTAVH